MSIPRLNISRTVANDLASLDDHILQGPASMGGVLRVRNLVLSLFATAAAHDIASADMNVATYQRRSRVYFVEATGLARIKIGHARVVRERLVELNTSSPCHLRLLCVIPGTHVLEGLLHRQFKASRVRGEWFDEPPEMRAFIAAVRGVE